MSSIESKGLEISAEEFKKVLVLKGIGGGIIRGAEGIRRENGKIIPEYQVWTSMRRRCYSSTDKAYHNYGGRGIAVCDRWFYCFADFLSDVGRRPSPRHSLDRWPNKDGNYEPGNVRWATPKEQSNNRNGNILFTINGETKILTQWAEQYGLSRFLVNLRIRICKWPIEKALTIPSRKHQKNKT